MAIKRPRLNELLTSCNDNQDPFRNEDFDSEKDLSCFLPSGPSWNSSNLLRSSSHSSPSNILSIHKQRSKFQLWKENGKIQHQHIQDVMLSGGPPKNNLMLNKRQPMMHKNTVMNTLIPKRPMMVRDARTQQQPGSRPDLGGDQLQGTMNYSFNPGASTGPTTQRMPQPVGIFSRIIPPRQYASENFITQNPPQNVVVSSTPMQASRQSHQQYSRPPPTSTTITTITTPSTHPSPAASGSEQSKKKKIPFKPDDLRTALMPTLDKLIRQDPESHPFKQPVDPIALGIPDYFDIIKKPMDLSTIRRNLEQGVYRDPWEYVDDVWLMFDNARLYNRKGSDVYRYCTKLTDVFKVEIDPVMQCLGYCCGRSYAFNPHTLCCYGKQLCIIPRNVKYYSYQNRYTYCQKCFSEIQEDTVTIGDDPIQPQARIKKEQFVEMKNDHLELEPFVECQECGRKLHQICVLHMDCIWPRGFICDNCLKQNNTKRKENKFNAKRLSATKLGMYIEMRVNNFLKKKKAGAGEVYIRVVSSSDKIVKVKPEMKNRFVESGDLVETFPYRAKALFAFEDIDGVDVCFFGMHVQEYGSECPTPNTRRVYITYLDSVHFFKPRQFRTAVYHEILLGYLDYVKQLGYTMAHIWACPPSEGDDYIFHCHPQDQKIPKPKRLQEWYKKLLDKGMTEGIVLDYKDILKQAIEDNLTSAIELPYFEGDFWPKILEDSIKELDEEEKRRQAEAAKAAAAATSTDEMEVVGNGKNKGKRKAKKSTKSKSKNNKKSKAPQTVNDLSTKIFTTMEWHKEAFLVIRLHSPQSSASLGTIQDPDPCLTCDLMDGRDTFLTLARDNHYEFSSLRRAKFSTMAMLYELHTQEVYTVYTCNKCDKKDLEKRHHCTVCDDFDLCDDCFRKGCHPHKMKLILTSNDGKVKKEVEEERKLGIERCRQILVHACQCEAQKCNNDCYKMKRTIAHAQTCDTSDCKKCAHLKGISKYHGRHCQNTSCTVCSILKTILGQQRARRRLEVTPTRPSLHDSMNMMPPRRLHQQPDGLKAFNQLYGPQDSRAHMQLHEYLKLVRQSTITPELRPMLQELRANPQLIVSPIWDGAQGHQSWPGQDWMSPTFSSSSSSPILSPTQEQ